MNITVYLGASDSNDKALSIAVRELGRWIGESGHTVIYGGSKTGLMGGLADSALEAGGKVIGIEPLYFIEKGFQHDGLTQLIITKDMSERKTKMIELSDAFIAFPGGIGTLEEISEIMRMITLGETTNPCIFYNLNGYYDDMKSMLNKMIEKGLSSEEKQKGIYFASDLTRIKELVTR